MSRGLVAPNRSFREHRGAPAIPYSHSVFGDHLPRLGLLGQARTQGPWKSWSRGHYFPCLPRGEDDCPPAAAAGPQPGLHRSR